MFCKICGTQVADDALFCLNCGNKVEHDEVAATEQPVMQEPSYAQPMAQEAMYSQPMEQAQPYSQPAMQSPSYHQPSFSQNNQTMGVVQPVYQQPVYQNKPSGKSSKAKPFAIIFGVLACIVALLVSIDSFIDGELGVGFENLGISVFAVLIICYGVSKSKGTAILKGVGVLAVTALHVIFFGVSAFKAGVGIFSDADAGTDYYYAVVLLLGLVLFYVYMLINVIKSFTNSDKPSGFMLLVGYISALLIVAAFVVDCVSDTSGLFAFGFVPVDLAVVLMILADIFAVFSRTKK